MAFLVLSAPLFPARAGNDPLIDRVAADFYKKDLRASQSRNIEAATADIYIGLDAEARARFRDERRARWREMGDDARSVLRAAKTPQFENLTESQKAPFRRAAAAKLGLGSDPRGDAESGI